MRLLTASIPRRLSVVMLVLTLAGAAPEIWSVRGAQPGNGFAPAWTEWGSSGTVGVAQLTETAFSPGATCLSDVRFNPPLVDVIGKGPTVWPASGYQTQPVGWRAVLYQELPGGRNVRLQATDSGVMTTSQSQPITLANLGFNSLAAGPAYFLVAEVNWYSPAGSVGAPIEGTATYRIQIHRTRTTTAGGTQLSSAATCRPPLPPTATLTRNSGNVGASLGFTISYFPIGTKVNLRWDGQNLGTVVTDSQGRLTSTFVVPPAPLGQHSIRWFTGTWSVSAKFTIEARIRASPGTIARGQTLNVSLRGYAAGETVRIRWKRGASWIELSRVTTTATGSADLTLVVPAWAPDGTASIRGDGSQGRSQTNGVTVSGGQFRPAETAPLPTPTSTAAITPTATATASPTATAEPTSTPALEPTPTLEATSSPTVAAPDESTATATLEPTPTSPPAEPTIPIGEAPPEGTGG